MTPPTEKFEEEPRLKIDTKFEATGWVIQDHKRVNLIADDYGINGVAVREHPTDTDPTSYMLFIAGKACGVIEANSLDKSVITPNQIYSIRAIDSYYFYED